MDRLKSPSHLGGALDIEAKAAVPTVDENRDRAILGGRHDDRLAKLVFTDGGFELWVVSRLVGLQAPAWKTARRVLFIWHMGLVCIWVGSERV
jgi:hypothetical protein